MPPADIQRMDALFVALAFVLCFIAACLIRLAIDFLWYLFTQFGTDQNDTDGH